MTQTGSPDMSHPSPSPRYRQLAREFDLWAGETDPPPGAGPTGRALSLAAAAGAQGRRDVLRDVLRLALERGVPPEVLYEVLLQTYLFAGYPRAINALAELAALRGEADGGGAVVLDADEGRDAVWRQRGEQLCRRVYGTAYEALLVTMGRISPDLARWMVVEGYGKVLSRPGLDAVTRELTAVAALLVLSVPDQLRAHLRGALLVGASPAAVETTLRTAALLDAVPLPAALHLLGDVRARVGTTGSEGHPGTLGISGKQD